MTRVLLLEHHAAGLFEKLRAVFGKQAGPFYNLAQQTQGERILVEAVESATRELMKNVGGVDCGKLVREKSKGVFAGKRLEVKQERRVSVVVLDSGTVGRPLPVRFAARKNEQRAARLGELPQDGIDRATQGRGGDFVEPVDDNALAPGDKCLRPVGAFKPSGAAIVHTGLIAECSGEDSLSHARIAQDDDRRGDGGDVVLPDKPPLSAVIFVRQCPVDRVRHYVRLSGRLAQVDAAGTRPWTQPVRRRGHSPALRPHFRLHSHHSLPSW